MQAMRVLKAAAVEVGAMPALTGAAAARAAVEAEAHRREVEAAYRRGFEDGSRDAEATGVAAAPTVAAAIQRVAADAARSAAEQHAADTAALVEAGIELARWILRRELQADPHAALERLAEAMLSMRAAGAVEIRVAPALVEIVQEWAGGEAEVKADTRLAPGEAVVTAGPASADLTFDQAFTRARAALGADGTAGEVLS